MAEYVELNLGSGGAKMRALAHADGTHSSLGVMAYATTLVNGANVIQVVDATHGLPTEIVGGTVDVEQSDEAALNTTAYQGGMWTVALAGGATVAISGTVAATQSGAWSVSVPGTVAVTQSGSWTVDLSAGTNLVGKTAAGADGSTIYNGTTALTPVFTPISAAASGNNQIVAGVTGKKIRVIQWSFSAHGEVVAEWRSGATTVVSGPRPFIKCASAGGSPSQWGRFETAPGEALNLNLSAAVAVGGELTYVLV